MNTTREYDVITFGETMIRLAAPMDQRFEQATALDFKIGGTESNVMVAMARLGFRVAWVSRLTDNALGRKMAREIGYHGVDTSHVIWTDTDRVGTYFIEFGRPPRGIQVIYDRADSAVSKLTPEMMDWTLLDRARILHLTGITPGLSESCRQTVARAIEEAGRRGVTVSFDVNYRAKVWSPQRACEVLSPLCAKVDILICADSDAEIIFGIERTPGEECPGESVARGLAARFGASTVMTTVGAEGAALLHEGVLHHQPATPITPVDRVGAGDAYAAGLLWGYLEGDTPRGLLYGDACASLKFSIPGDFALISRDEVMEVIEGRGKSIDR